jgi:NAD(P)-dependent dehydrogenase (short-subunit alcohol dehydrogenase family)
MGTQKLKGKVALITGASRGLGKAMAIALAAEGAQVALVARDREKLEAVAREAALIGHTPHVFTLDVTNEDDVNALEPKVREALGPVNILINNAGINIRKRLVDFTLTEWRSVMDANLTSVFLMCRAFIPQMKGKGYGRIVNLASIMSHVSLPERSAYSASKTALLGLTRALSLELAAEAITVNCISPGPFATEMNQKIINDAELNAQFLANLPVGRWGNVEEVGALAVYLCSPEAGFVTGTDVVIDGGWLAR